MSSFTTHPIINQVFYTDSVNSKEHLIKDIDHDKEHLAKKIGKLITRAEEVAESEDFFKFPKKKHGKGKKIGKIFGERDVEDLGELHKLLDAKKKKEEEIGLALKALVGVSITMSYWAYEY